MQLNHYSFLELNKRLFLKARSVKGKLIISTFASIFGNLSQMGIMGCGSLWLLGLSGNIANHYYYLWGMFFFSVMIAVCRFLEGYVSHAGAYSLLANMRIEMFNTLRKLSPACLVDDSTGELLSIAVSDIETIEFFFAHTIGPMCTVILLPIITLSIAFYCNPLFVVFLLPVYLIICIIFPLIALKLGSSAGLKYRENLARLKSKILESVFNIKDIQIFGKGDQKLEEVMNQNAAVNRDSHFLTLHRQLVTSVPTFFVYLARILVIGVASYLTLNSHVDQNQVVFLSFIVSASFSSTQSLTMVISSLLETYAAAKRIFTLEDRAPRVEEVRNPIELKKIEKIEFKNVYFRYTPDTPYIFENANIIIHKYDKIGISGISGAGKSTFIRLLLRFYDVDQGKILINDLPIQNYSLESLHNRITVLEQSTLLFDDTIANNIALGKPGATKDEIITAAKRAGIHDLILTLPEGYETKMGQMNSRLSGGERQRIGIARSLIMDSDMLVMDEPTSNLDVLNEKGLLMVLEKEFSNKTYLLVSHRQSSFTKCDHILFFKEHQIQLDSFC